jgi:uncharacterized membrane protein
MTDGQTYDPAESFARYRRPPHNTIVRPTLHQDGIMQSLIPNPLHPAVVHLPIAFAVLLPLFAVGALWFIRRGSRPRSAWGVFVAMSAALVASAWVALQTGEQQEEHVEDIVSEASIHQHEEAADLFLAVSAGVLIVGVGGLVGGRIGQVGRWVAAAGTVAVLASGWNVGHSGGMLVYRDGAASAYVQSGGTGAPGGEGNEGRRGDSERRRGGDPDDR